MELADWFLDFVVRVKNLRGVVTFGTGAGEEALHGLRWIGKHFRYRDVGFTDGVFERAAQPVRDRLGKKPFVRVSPPSDVMKEIADDTCPPDVEEIFWESLTTASAYACPLVLVDTLEEVASKDFWLFTVRVGESLDTNSAKFHLRVCDYAALDALGPVTKKLLQSARSEHGLVSLLHERRQEGLRDGEKRFWRLAENSGNEAVIAILDPLGPAWTSRPEAVAKALNEHGALAAALFSLVPAFVVVPGVTVEE